jgi:hypothetical protein
VGKEVAGFRIDALIGKGESATVFQATQLRLERTVALKVLFANRLGSQEVIEHFLAEAKRAAKLTHPNAVQVFHVGRESSAIYVAMELIKGIGLEEALEAPGGLTEAEALDILKPVTNSLSAAREDGILHRNLKPGNILITTKGSVKVADFGMAIPIREGDGTALADAAWLGTMLYMSPEQCQGRELDERSDIYSLGIILYQMLTGKMPFSAESSAKLIDKVLHEPVPDPRESLPELSEGMADLVARMTAKDPAERFQSYEALEAAARPLWDVPRDVRPEDALIFLVLSVAFPEIAAEELESMEEVAAPRRRTPLIAAAAVALLVLVAGFGLRPFIWKNAEPSAPPAAPPTPATAGEIEAPEPGPEPKEPTDLPVPIPQLEDLPDLKADLVALGEKVAEFTGRGRFYEGIKVFQDFEEQAGPALIGALRDAFERERQALVSKIIERQEAGVMGVRACFDGADDGDEEVGAGKEWIDDLKKDFDQFPLLCDWANKDTRYRACRASYDALNDHFNAERRRHRKLQQTRPELDKMGLDELKALQAEVHEYCLDRLSLFKTTAMDLLRLIDERVKKEEERIREKAFWNALEKAEAAANSDAGLSNALAVLEAFLTEEGERLKPERRENLRAVIDKYRTWESEIERFSPVRSRVESLMGTGAYADLEDALPRLSSFHVSRMPRIRDAAKALRDRILTKIGGIAEKWLDSDNLVLIRRANRLKGFLIAEFETTNAEFGAYITATGAPSPPHWENSKCPEGEENLPVVFISPKEAEAYCAWLSEKENAEVRLPTTEEWRLAAKWDGEQFSIYPWGDRYVDGKANVSGGRTKPRSGQAGDVSPNGVLAMAGNVAEIVTRSDRGTFAAKGGCCADGEFPELAARSEETQDITPDTRGRFLGFRVVRALE